DQDLPYFYNLAQTFAFPSLAEGFGFPVLEALACGTPVICSDAPALKELVGEAALQHPAKDANLLAAHLLNLLGSAPERARLREAGLTRAARFNWFQTVQQTVEVYHQIANCRKTG